MKKLILILILFLPLLHFLFDKREINYIENKKFSKITFNYNIKKYYDSFAKSYSERFILKDKIIPINFYINYLLGHSKNKNIFIGKDGYLFLKNVNNITLKHRGILVENDERLNEIYNSMENFIKYFKNQGTKVIFFQVPNQQSIYKNKMPFWYTYHSNINLFNYFEEKFSYKYKENFLNLLKILSDEELTYHKFESHWNSYGMYLSYNEILKKTLNRETNNIYKFENQIKNWHRLFLKENFKGVSIFHNSKKYIKNKNIIILGDSFSIPFIKFFENDFKNILRIDKDHEKLDFNKIKKFNPDYFIIMIVERNFFDYDLQVSGIGKSLYEFKKNN